MCCYILYSDKITASELCSDMPADYLVLIFSQELTGHWLEAKVYLCKIGGLLM